MYCVYLLRSLARPGRTYIGLTNDVEKRLRIPEILRTFAGLQRISRKRVLGCARILGVRPAIVVGALQFEGRLGYQALNDLKVPVREKLEAGTA